MRRMLKRTGLCWITSPLNKFELQLLNNAICACGNLISHDVFLHGHLFIGRENINKNK